MYIRNDIITNTISGCNDISIYIDGITGPTGVLVSGPTGATGSTAINTDDVEIVYNANIFQHQVIEIDNTGNAVPSSLDSIRVVGVALEDGISTETHKIQTTGLITIGTEESVNSGDYISSAGNGYVKKATGPKGVFAIAVEDAFGSPGNPAFFKALFKKAEIG